MVSSFLVVKFQTENCGEDVLHGDWESFCLSRELSLITQEL